MKTKFAVPVILLAGFAAFTHSAMASDEFAGAVLGGATGAVVGHALGGQDGAVVGGALGAVVGAAAASDRDNRVVYYGPPPPVYGPPPAVVYAPPPVVYGPPRIAYAPVVPPRPAYYRYYGWPRAREHRVEGRDDLRWREHDGKADLDHEGRHDYRGW